MWTNFVKSKSRSDYAITRKKWLHMSIVDFNGAVRAEDGETISHNEYVEWFIDELITMIRSYQYSIEDENKVKHKLFCIQSYLNAKIICDVCE